MGIAFLAAASAAAAARASGTTRFVLDGNRTYAEIAFVRPNGSLHRALVFVDMGSPSMILKEALYRELGLDRGKGLVFRIGSLAVTVPAAEVQSDPGKPRPMGPDLAVEGMLPAGVLQRYDVGIDYREKTLTLAKPGTLRRGGIPVPFRRNEKTGLIAVNARIAGKTYAITIDDGSAYTWVRQDAARGWLGSHPDWERGIGAVGAANMTMAGDGSEAEGILLRIPEIGLGPLTLRDVGALAAAPGRSPVSGLDLFDWYSRKNAVPVIGFIGGNALKAFRLTIDYSRGILYWSKQVEPDVHDLDQVGLTLRAEAGAFFVAGIARRNGRPTVEGVLPGDRLIRVGDLETAGATWGALFAAMHGRPGETRRLVLERGGRQLTVDAPVTAF